jgi:hypothetical protein
VIIDGINLLTQAIEPTGGWQNWATFENKLNLSTGEHTLRLQVAKSGFNLNWFQLGEVSLGIDGIYNKSPGMKIFPNPGKELLYIQMKERASCVVRVTDVLGKTLVNHVLNNSGSIDISDLKPGVYLVQISSESGRVTRKLLIQ